MPAPISTEVYQKLLAAYRDQPGNVANAAKLAGVRWPCAKRAWAGPGWKARPEHRPIRELLAAEASTVATAKELEEAAALDERREAEMKRAKLRSEAQQAEESILRLARSTTLQGLGSLARLQKGVNVLADRIGDQLERGVDAAGKPLNIDPMQAMGLLRTYSSSLNRFTDAARALITIERLREGLPTDLLGVTITHDVTPEQVAETLGEASRALDRARRLELLKGGKDASKATG